MDIDDFGTGLEKGSAPKPSIRLPPGHRGQTLVAGEAGYGQRCPGRVVLVVGEAGCGQRSPGRRMLDAGGVRNLGCTCARVFPSRAAPWMGSPP